MKPNGEGEAKRRAAGQRCHLTLRGNIFKAPRPCVGVSSWKGDPKSWVGTEGYLHNLIFPLPFLFLRLGFCSFPHPASPVQPYLWIFHDISILYLLWHIVLSPSSDFLRSVSPSHCLSDCVCTDQAQTLQDPLLCCSFSHAFSLKSSLNCVEP